MKNPVRSGLLAAVAALLVAPLTVRTHCDTLDGPVVQAAREAIARGDVTPVLKWVKPDEEAGIREAFARTLAVRSLSPEAAELADRYFFETLVRIHRAGVGEPFTGLKPAAAVDPGIAAADRALETGAIDATAEELGERVANRVKAEFRDVLAKRARMNESVEAGREYVAAYVEFIHQYEQLYAAAAHGPARHAHH